MEVKLYGWDATAAEFVKVRCNSSGELLVDTSSMTFDVLQLNPQSTPPTAVEGGIYYLDTDDHFYGGVG